MTRTDANLTMTGDLLGTLRYMSPEQVQAKHGVLDHRTDVYSFGVTLYELLTLQPAFPGDDRERLIRQVIEDDPRPPRQVNKAIPKDLETIVLKATAKEPASRYGAAHELADDLGRFLDDKPIQARGPSLVQRAAKWSRRHTAIVWSAAVVLATAVVCLAVSTVLIGHQRDVAEEHRQRAELALADAEVQRQRAERNFRQARQAVDKYFTLVSESTLLDEPGLQPLRRQLIEGAVSYYEAFAARRSDDPKIQLELAAAHLRLAQAYYQVGRLDDTVSALERGFKLLEEVAPHYPETSHAYLALAGFWHSGRPLPGAHRQPCSDPAHALGVMQKGIQLWKRLVERHPKVPGFQRDLARFYELMRESQQALGRRADALRTEMKSCEVLETLVENHPEFHECQADLAWAYHVMARLLEANDPDQAEELYRRAIATQQQANVSVFRCSIASYRRNFAKFLQRRNRVDESIEHLRQAITIYEELVAEFRHVAGYRTTLFQIRVQLADVLQRAGRDEEAELYSEMIAPNPHDAYAYCQRAQACERLKKFEQALADYEKAVELEPENPAWHHHLALFRTFCEAVNLRDYHVAVKHAKTAAELAKKAIELAPKKGGYCNTLGAAQYRAGDWNAAIDALEKSMQLRSGGDSTDWLFLAMAHWQLAHKDEARQWYDKAVEWMDKNKPDHEELRRFRAERVAGYCGSSHSTGSSFSRSYRDALRPGYVSVTRQARCGHRAIVADESGSATAPAKQDSTRRPPGV